MGRAMQQGFDAPHPGDVCGPPPFGAPHGSGLMLGGAAPAMPNPGACFNCGASDHIARQCPHPRNFSAQCHACGEMGHLARDCPNTRECERVCVCVCVCARAPRQQQASARLPARPARHMPRAALDARGGAPSGPCCCRVA
jgi:hypothetical protein